MQILNFKFKIQTRMQTSYLNTNLNLKLDVNEIHEF